MHGSTMRPALPSTKPLSASHGDQPAILSWELARTRKADQGRPDLTAASAAVVRQTKLCQLAPAPPDRLFFPASIRYWVRGASVADAAPH